MKKYLILKLIFIFTVSLLTVGCSSSIKKKLKNHAPLLVRQSQEMPREIVSLIFPGGPSLFSADKQGAVDVLALMLQEGPEGMTSDEFRKKLFLLNADVSFSGSPRSFRVKVVAPKESLRRTLLLTDRVLKNPKMSQKNFNIAKKKTMSLTKLKFDSMREVIFYYGIRQAFDQHPDTSKGGGSPKSVGNVQLRDLKSVYESVINWQSLFFSAVGPMTGDELQNTLDRLWPEQEGVVEYKKFHFPKLNGNNYKNKRRKITLIHQKGAKDSQVLFVYPDNVQRDSKERVIGEVTHRLLGGGLSGRLGSELRVKRGLTYYAGSFLMSGVPGWSAYTFGGHKQIAALIAGIPEVISGFLVEKLDRQEVELAKKALTNRFKEGMELPYERLSEDIRSFLYDLDHSYPSDYLDILDGVTVGDVNNFRRDHTQIQGGYLYVMGDRKVLFPLLKEIGYHRDDIKIINKREVL